MNTNDLMGGGRPGSTIDALPNNDLNGSDDLAAPRILSAHSRIPVGLNDSQGPKTSFPPTQMADSALHGDSSYDMP